MPRSSVPGRRQGGERLGRRGGFGCSGVGRELGIGGLHEYTELKSINYTGFTLKDAKMNRTS